VGENMIPNQTSNSGKPFLNKYFNFRSSIYGRVIFIIAILSLILFASFGVIFLSVNEEHMKTVIRQNGNNIGYLVEGSLYRSMLENDRSALQYTLDIINTMPGIDEVNMYDNSNELAYTSFAADSNNHSNPHCTACHSDLDEMFPRKEKTYKIISLKSGCSMTDKDNGHRHLLIRSPILNEKSCYTSSCHAHTQSEDVLGSLIIKIPLADLDDAVKKSTAEFYLLATLSTILLASVLIFFTNKKIKKPLGAIVEASQAVANGDKDTRLEIKPNQLSDIRMVSLALNDMLDNLQAANKELHNWSQQLEYKVQKKTEELGAAQSDLIHVERIASLGKLSLSVAHEINNPLSGILVYTKLVYKQLSNQDIDPAKKELMLKQLMLIENETKRCGDIVKGLLDFSRKDQENFEPKHIHEVLRDTCELMNHPMKIANVSFYTDLSAKLDEIYCSPNQIKQAFMALLVNASEAVTENAEVVLKTKNIDDNFIKIDVSDNGIGISKEDLPHIFEPFFSTKQNTSGHGLGLAIVHGIIKNHKGKIEVKSEPGKGTTISILLPLIKDVT